MTIRKSAERFSTLMDREFVAWLDAEGGRRDRSRAWMIQEAVRQWAKRLERERKRRKGKR